MHTVALKNNYCESASFDQTETNDNKHGTAKIVLFQWNTHVRFQSLYHFIIILCFRIIIYGT